MAIEWLQKVFQPHTESGSRPRALIIDGHDSHVTIEFVQYCVQHNICLYSLPAHSTHFLQPLDVGQFGSLQRAYSKSVDHSMRHGPTGLFKGNFLPLYVQAREIAYTTKCITHDWQATGIILLNS